jgi:hypothetical protein
MEQTYVERPPIPALARHLSCVWVQRVAADAAPYAHRTVPNAGVEVVCRLGEAPRVIGPQTGPTDEVLPPGAVVVGVRFRPGAAPLSLDGDAYRGELVVRGEKRGSYYERPAGVLSEDMAGVQKL